MERRTARLLIALCALGAAVRGYFWSRQDALHLDEFYQYVEPAFTRLTGAGIEAWEFREGVRSWVLPSFHGAWMVLFQAAGLPRVWFGPALQILWGVASLSLIFVGFYAGSAICRRLIPQAAASAPRADQTAGLMAALLCAAFPVIAKLSVHTLSELPAMLCLVLGLSLCLDLDQLQTEAAMQRARWVGALIASGVLLRISYAPCAVMPIAVLIRWRRLDLLPQFAFGAVFPVALFGLVDWATWGAPFVSFQRYIRFNMLEGRASEYGIEPASYYAELIRSELPVSIWALLGLCILGWRASWPLSLTACGIVGLLSTQAHKEPRFIVLFWPLILIVAAGTAGALVLKLQPGRARRLGQLATWLGLAYMLVDAYAHTALETNERNTADRVRIATWLGSHARITGILMDQIGFSAGQSWLGSTAPLVRFDTNLLANPLFSHVVVPKGSADEAAAVRAGFRAVHAEGPLCVLAKAP